MAAKAPTESPTAKKTKKAPSKPSADEAPGRPDDTNQVSLVGRLATAPDVRSFASGASLARLLVTTRLKTDRPRTDVVPVTLWDPPEAVKQVERGELVEVVGSVQRRFWSDGEGRKSRIEVVASSVALLGQNTDS